ncbi:MAG: GNAT family N-acetyltransferase [Alphaproteobacteria bacterium]|jgi:ribosomal-protein-alanine N-acetyltransferase|nr:GNAT family N-acetyltransferase [Alphaproteobacteria bacterium]
MAAELELAAFDIQNVGAFDLGRLARLHRACFEEPWSKSDLAHLLALPGGLGLIARSRGLRRLGFDTRRPVGFSLCRLTRDESELLSIGVAPDMRRVGLATHLVRQSMRRCRAGGARCMFLEVAIDNPGAQALYDREGFREIGRREGYYRRNAGDRVAALTMRAEL